jgi:hypothetical protein
MLEKILDIINCILTGLIIVIFLSFIYCVIGAEDGHDHEQYIEVVDKYITHGRYGSPYYYIVYKFIDGCIEEIAVSSTEYYGVEVDK